MSQRPSVTLLTISRRRRRVSGLFNFSLGSSKRSNPKAPWPGIHHGDQLPPIIRGPIRSVNLLDRTHGLSTVPLQHRVAGMLWHRMRLAAVGVLLPNPNAELGAVSTRSDQETRTLHARAAVLLESVDWDLRCLVPLR
jgi:hypothetical protein